LHRVLSPGYLHYDLFDAKGFTLLENGQDNLLGLAALELGDETEGLFPLRFYITPVFIAAARASVLFWVCFKVLPSLLDAFDVTFEDAVDAVYRVALAV